MFTYLCMMHSSVMHAFTIHFSGAIFTTSWRARRCPWMPLDVDKKIQLNRSSRLAGYRQHIYIYECLILIYANVNPQEHVFLLVSHEKFYWSLIGRIIGPNWRFLFYYWSNLQILSNDKGRGMNLSFKRVYSPITKFQFLGYRKIWGSEQPS